jgi:hypothetical protein
MYRLELCLFIAIASISSIEIIDGAVFLALEKISLILFSDAPS